MAEGRSELFERPFLKWISKLGGSALIVVDVLKSVADLPETLRKDKTVVEVAGHILYHLIIFSLEYILLAVGVLFLAALGIGLILGALKLISFKRIQPWRGAAAGPFAHTVAILVVCLVGWLDYKYGFWGTVALVEECFAFVLSWSTTVHHYWKIS